MSQYPEIPTISAETEQTSPPGVYEHEGCRWRAKPGATTTFEERTAAAALFIELNTNRFWNPWEYEERADDLAQVQQIMDQWERAEPGHRVKTKRQVDAWLARIDRDWQRQAAADEKRYEANRKRHDPERESARLALLEQRALQARAQREFDRHRSGEAYPGMDPERRTQEMDKLAGLIAQHQSDVDQLTPIVGDPERVPNQNGYEPRDRRPWHRNDYERRRIEQVTTLRAELTGLDDDLAVVKDRSECSALSCKRDAARRRLNDLLAVPRLDPEDMCADCATPTSRPDRPGPIPHSCVAWPLYGASVRETWERVQALLEFHRKHSEPKSPPNPKPLAVIPSGLPIRDIVQRLEELQAQYPDATVKRGRANRWELWPAKGGPRSN